MPTDPLHQLQAAARSYGDYVYPGFAIRTCVLLDDAGRRIEVLVPPCSGDGSDGPGEPDEIAGWDFSRSVPRFEGVEYPISGRQLKVLKILAEADGPVPVEDLRAAWDGYNAGDGTIRELVRELKLKLKKLFPARESEPIESTGAGYALGIR